MSLHAHERFIARVVDVKDPEQSGRVKIRIYGIHDDATRMPDKDLPWARCVFPVTNPVREGVAGATTGLIKDCTVVGYFADTAKQIPLVDGTIGGLNDKKSDFPKSDRGEDFNEVLKTQLPGIAVPELKFVAAKTIGSIDFLGQGIGDLMKEIGEGDLISVIMDAKHVLENFKNLKDNIVSSSIEQVNGIVNAFKSDIGEVVEQTTGVDTTDIGVVVNKVEDVANVVKDPAAELTDSINYLAGNIATRTSKTPITTVDDALTRVSGHTFVMDNVMPHLDSTLNRLVSKE